MEMDQKANRFHNYKSESETIPMVKSVVIFGFHKSLTKTIFPYRALNVKTPIGIGQKNQRNRRKINKN